MEKDIKKNIIDLLNQDKIYKLKISSIESTAAEDTLITKFLNHMVDKGLLICEYNPKSDELIYTPTSDEEFSLDLSSTLNSIEHTDIEDDGNFDILFEEIINELDLNGCYSLSAYPESDSDWGSKMNILVELHNDGDLGMNFSEFNMIFIFTIPEYLFSNQILDRNIYNSKLSRSIIH